MRQRPPPPRRLRAFRAALVAAALPNATLQVALATHVRELWARAASLHSAGSRARQHGIPLPGKPMAADSTSVLSSSARAAATRRGWRPPRWLWLVLFVSAAAGALTYELHTSTLGSLWIGAWARSLTYQVEPGPIRAAGPYAGEL